MRKLLLVGLIGLFAFAGCSKDDENEPGLEQLSTIAVGGEKIPITFASSMYDDTGTDPFKRRGISFTNEDDKVLLNVYANYLGANFGEASFQHYYHHSGNEEPDYHYFEAHYYDMQDGGWQKTFQEGTMEITKYDPEENILHITFKATLKDGRSVMGSYSGLYVETDTSF